MFVDYSLRWKCLVSEVKIDSSVMSVLEAQGEYSAAYNQRQEALTRPRDLVDSSPKANSHFYSYPAAHPRYSCLTVHSRTVSANWLPTLESSQSVDRAVRLGLAHMKKPNRMANFIER
jgi:hypothetical protein